MSGPVRCFLCGAFVSLVASVTAADERPIVGKYKCVGDAGNGNQYEGTVEIRAAKDTLRVAWDVNGAKSEGLAIRDGNLLSVAIRSDANSVAAGLAVYRIKEDGSLAGRWSYFGWEGRVLTETWTPEAMAPAGNRPMPSSTPPARDEQTPMQQEVAKLSGKWALEAEWREGKPVEGAKDRKAEIEFDAELNVTFERVDGQNVGLPYNFSVWPAQEPKGLNRWSVVDDEDSYLINGIYKIEDDVLTYAFIVTQIFGKQPTSFEPSEGWTVQVYRRVGDAPSPGAGRDAPAASPGVTDREETAAEPTGNATKTNPGAKTGAGGAKKQ